MECLAYDPASKALDRPEFNQHVLVEDADHLQSCRHPVAGGLLVRWGIDLPMSVGAAAMSLSTIIVAANAQLLRRLTFQDAASVRKGSSEATA